MHTTFMERTYTWLTLSTMLLGVVIAGMFGVSLLIGGSAGESLAVFSGKLMTWGIRLAAIATLAGLVHIYLSKKHSLTMDADTDLPEEEEVVELNSLERRAL
ncbi:hypothetical protein [Fictibacillus phosphorivorans]|uniref:hypothetical protein n=1 Tax=Fictibacillus phosphorivorans TaxID=1221500 RepID=UPI00203B7B78|nr:hypothetical protein [Fictibacillus phosphorivorans]MCM3717651.1 hypothetical protein [Fictibacillus phosphorivorans]MCM3775551.1 hypothetical protein [Fictibacillus phosphorivorans]